MYGKADLAGEDIASYKNLDEKKYFPMSSKPFIFIYSELIFK